VLYRMVIFSMTLTDP